MPKLTKRPPAYRLFRPRNLACVTVDGKRVYLGHYGSPESRERYAEIVAQWEAQSCEPLAPSRREKRRAKAAVAAIAEPLPLTLVEVVARFLDHAQRYYVKPDGTTGNEFRMFGSAVRPLLRMYGRMPARKLRPRHLKSLRETMIAKGWQRTSPTGRIVSGRYTRKGLNSLVRRIKHVIAWAVEEELLPAAVHERLRRVRSLRKGKSAAVERPPVRPVSDQTLEATLPYLSPVVADMVRLQRLTGARPGEICDMRPCDVSTTGDVWTYRPGSHKTEAHGHERLIHLGPRSQDILRPYLLRPADSCCFSPADAERQRKRAARDRRKTKVQPSQCDRSKDDPARKAGEHYGKDAYNRAIARAVEKANRAEVNAAQLEEREAQLLARWTPNMVRHTRATELRRLHGIEAAQVCLGHSDPKTTLIYAEADAKLAADVARRTG